MATAAGVVASMRPAVATVTSMHEQVNDRAEQQQRIRRDSEDVCPVLLPKEEGCNGQKQAEAQPARNVHWVAASGRISSGLHDAPHWRFV
jgi:hypothetical protein